MECNNIIWSPSKITDIDKIERTLRRFTKYLYTERNKCSWWRKNSFLWTNCPLEFGPNGNYFPIDNKLIFEFDRKISFKTKGITFSMSTNLISISKFDRKISFKTKGITFSTSKNVISKSTFDREIPFKTKGITFSMRTNLISKSKFDWKFLSFQKEFSCQIHK